MYFLTLPPHPHMKANRIYLFASTNLRKQFTPIKRGVSHKSPALAKNLIMVIHNFDSNSLWAEALKDNTGGELILGCA
jgi:hypothetical protein